MKKSKTMINKKKCIMPYFILLTLLICQLHGQAQQFTVYNSWDFEDETLGTYTDQEVREDFDVKSLYSHNTASIVEDVINGDTTKVLSVRHDGNQLTYGFDLEVKLDSDYLELYMSYNLKFSEEFNSTSGGKIPGFCGFPIIEANQCPGENEGFVIKNMYKQAGSLITYHYDRTPGHNYPNQCPWAEDRYKYDTIFFNNGCWYNITRRLKMNSFSDGVANADGIHEVWVDGRMIFKEPGLIVMSKDDNTMKIDGIHIAHWYGGSGTSYTPVNTCYGYFDNIKVWVPDSDSTFGTINSHDPDLILPTPDVITDRTVYYDSLITVEGTLQNSEYGSEYSECIDEAYLIDAGVGNTITYTLDNYSLAHGDFLFFYDGNTTDARIIKMYEGKSGTNKVFKSTGRYMFIRFSTERVTNGPGWTGTIEFENKTTGSNEKRNLDDSNNKVSVFPVPGTDLITIRGIGSPTELSVFDIHGRKVLYKKEVNNNDKININVLQKGVYSLVFAEKKNYSLKFIKE